MRILPATLADWGAIEQIYRAGIRSGNATFQTEDEIPDGETWFASKVQGLIFKAEDPPGLVVGWCALSRVSNRRVYAGVAEVSLYVAESARGQGVGTHLLRHLITASEEAGIWTLQAGIFPENVTSIHLCEKLGFRLVGRRERVGQQQDVWRDVMLLERRSDRI